MSSEENDNGRPIYGDEIEGALVTAKAATLEVANLELALRGTGGLTESEGHLLEFAVGQGWVTCLEYLSTAGYIELKYR